MISSECATRRDRANAVCQAKADVWVAEAQLVDTVLIAAPWAFAAEQKAVAAAQVIAKGRDDATKTT